MTYWRPHGPQRATLTWHGVPSRHANAFYNAMCRRADVVHATKTRDGPGTQRVTLDVERVVIEHPI